MRDREAATGQSRWRDGVGTGSNRLESDSNYFYVGIMFLPQMLLRGKEKLMRSVEPQNLIKTEQKSKILRVGTECIR